MHTEVNMCQINLVIGLVVSLLVTSFSTFLSLLLLILIFAPLLSPGAVRYFVIGSSAAFVKNFFGFFLASA